MIRASFASLWRRAGPRVLSLAFASLVLMCTAQAWGAGGKPATKLVNVADTRAMAPGFSRWTADVYNDSLVLYGLVVVGIMAGMGAVLGFGFDRVVGLLGINLGKLDHHE